MTIRMPAEWESHEWLWIGYPWNAAEWGGAETLARAQAQICAFADAVRADGKGEQIRLVCNDQASAIHARALLNSDAQIVVERIGDVWLRDTGPICVVDSMGARSLADFRFNGWGGKYEMPGDEDIGARLAATTPLPCHPAPFVFEGGAVDTDGTGLFVTTEDCLLNPNRNPGLDKRQIETLLAGSLGLRDMLWLRDGLVNDHTDGHVDNLARFVAPGVIAIPQATTDDDPNAAIYADAIARAQAHCLTVAPMPSPGRVEVGGAIIPASYMNFFIGNAAVVVPLYGRANDDAALDALKPFFPDRELVGLPADAILAGGGSFHCTSQQMPAQVTGNPQ
ncbi:MAG: agmatine deiminase family protein [Sphingobium sp.]|nr:agmatine deiminase family protein [Sphingobium sp.]MBP6112695.1 agmatine deiminase family protein [Sphingobium sp.]MBP8669882.1 agmatine deiminase family protein [Sphingobium sp.]MBP9157813.1 agmatine deiminase family protein [Sphingobium sp.]